MRSREELGEIERRMGNNTERARDMGEMRSSEEFAKSMFLRTRVTL